MLARTSAVAELLAGHDDALIITGLGSAANDVAEITDAHPRAFTMDGVMGAATSVGLGVALAVPSKEVIVVTGDGELLMNGTSLATVAMQNPANLRIIVVDNGLYGLTGGQPTAAATVLDIESLARACGVESTMTVRTADDMTAARVFLEGAGRLALVVVKVEPGPGAERRIERDGTVLRDRFRDHVAAAVEAS